MSEATRVLIADDHPLYLDGLKVLLDRPPSLSVVAAVATGSEAVAAAAELIPDVVVMDLQLPDLSGIDATRLITSTNPSVSVLVLTMFDDDDLVFAAMRAGARGYLLKGADHADIARAVDVVARGDVIFGAAVAQRVLRFFAQARSSPATQAFPELTAREREVLDLVAGGHANDAIAQRLLLSTKTVRNHLSNIFLKLHVVDRAEAIVKARRAGLGDA